MRIAVPVLIVAVLVVVLLLHHIAIRRPLPRIAGSALVDGVGAAVHIVRDRRGVPHIRAETMEDAAFAVGVVHAQDRGWQLELMRRVACGRLAEMAGPEGLEADRMTRRLGLARVALAEEALLEGPARAMLEAYSAGVTSILCTGVQARPLELLLTRVHPEPWRPAHSLAVARLIGFGLACDLDFELQRLRLLEAVGPELAASLEPGYPEDAPVIVGSGAGTATTTGGPGVNAAPPVPAETAAALRSRLDALAGWLPSGARAAASNSWVVDGTLTATGRPLLCNDPHLPPSVPSIWYQLHVDAGDDFASAGVGFPGLPFTVIGHNRRCAWGFTNSFANVQDLVVEELVDAAGTAALSELGPLPVEHTEEVIRVRGRPDVVETVLTTRHGPVLERFTGADGRHRALALQWPALTATPAIAAGLLGLQRCAGWEEFRAAASALNLAPQNAVYADVDGHIGYVLAGPVPVRPGPASRVPLSGWDADRRFVRLLGAEELPQCLDPADHVLVTANNRVVDDAFPHHIGFDTMNGYRALRIVQLLRGRSGMDAALMRRIQMDIVSLPARQLIALLGEVRCASTSAEAMRVALVGWDGAMAPEASEPSRYAAFLIELAREVAEPLCGDSWRLLAGEMTHPVFGHAGNITGRLTPWLLDQWRRNDTSLLGGRSWAEVATAALEAAAASLRRDHGRPSRWRWGALHALPLRHALSARRPLGALFDLGAVEVGGDFDTVHATGYEPGAPYRSAGWAPSWRMVLDPGDWDAAAGVLIPGQSGHPGSVHYRDRIEDWRTNTAHAMAWTSAAVDRVAGSRLVLRPRAPITAPAGHDDPEPLRTAT